MKNILFQDLRWKINGKNVFDQSVNNSTKKSETLQKLNRIGGLLHSRVFLTLFTLKQKQPTGKFNEIWSLWQFNKEHV